MEKNKILIGNMKMNLTYPEVKNYIDKMKNYKDFIICPSSLYVSYFIDSGFNVGVQNISEYGQGAYTGEISVSQISSMNIKYSLIGHSERRHKFNETDEIINNKLIKAVSNNIISILCIGETLEERDSSLTKEVIKKQIENDLKNIEESLYENIIIAYEPVWAIGTGRVPSREDIEETVKYIKKIINDNYGFNPKVLYGGSVNENNINDLKEIDNVDGFLVGGACLVPDKFIKIIETIN